jgi:hypothetical protein
MSCEIFPAASRLYFFRAAQVFVPAFTTTDGGCFLSLLLSIYTFLGAAV